MQNNSVASKHFYLLKFSLPIWKKSSGNSAPNDFYFVYYNALKFCKKAIRKENINEVLNN